LPFVDIGNQLLTISTNGLSVFKKKCADF